MRHIVFTLLFLAFGNVLLAQQEAHYTHFMYNTLSLNPAVAGSKGHPTILALYRKQWLGFEGAPDSKLVSFHTPLGTGKRVGFGLTIQNDQLGINNNWSGSMAYAYRIKIDEDTDVQFGIQGSMRYFGLDFRNQIIRQSGDPSVLDGAVSKQYLGNFGAGIYVNYKQAFFGASVPNFFPNNIGVNTGVDGGSLSPHFYVMAGAMIPLSSSSDIVLRPSALAKVVNNAPFDLDLNLSLIFNNSFIFGLSYRLGGDGIGDSVDALLHYRFNGNMGIGISYDYSLSDLQDYNNGSIEAIVVYDFVKERKNMANPRFF